MFQECYLEQHIYFIQGLQTQPLDCLIQNIRSVTKSHLTEQCLPLKNILTLVSS